jgi:F-type H+-transporting ATPase subunit b
MELIKNFGLDPTLLAAQIVNFLIILLILKKFLYKPVLDSLKKRQVTIKEGLKQAEEARIRLEKIVAEERDTLRGAQLQSRKIIEDARIEAAELTRVMNEEARKQTEKLLIDTKQQIVRETSGAEKRLALSTSKIAVKLLEKSLKDFFTSKEQAEVLAQALKKIKRIK